MAPFSQTPEGMSPAILEMLDQAFSATWRELQAGKSPAASRDNEEATRAAIAKSITDLAATGVRDQSRLMRHGLHAAEQTKSRTRKLIHLPG
jgi:hypothetical protein